jgi:hypothetical protein
MALGCVWPSSLLAFIVGQILWLVCPPETWAALVIEKFSLKHWSAFWPAADDPVHGKAGEAYTNLKTASCEMGPGTTLIHNKESCIWSLQIQEYDDGCCFPNSICDLLQCNLYLHYMKLLNNSCEI